MKRILLKDYNISKALYHFYLRIENLASTEAIIVYQMGKVGSTTILKTLKASELDNPIYHIHDLKQETLKKDEKHYKNLFRGHYRHRIRPFHLWESQYLRSRLEKGNTKKWKIITVVRDPVARNISAFFQTLQSEVDLDYHQFLSMNNSQTQKVIEELIDIFLNRIRWHDYPLKWLDAELQDVLGIDVFASAFPTAKGYKIYRTKHINLLLLRLESLRDSARDAFKEFLDIDQFSLIKANIGSEKPYSDIYKKFKDRFFLPDIYIEKMYTSKYMKHFYTEEEISQFKEIWNKGSAESRKIK